MGKKDKAKKEKPLEDMTVKELREIALQVPDVVGVHGMNKDEIIKIVRQARGIPEPEKTKTSMRELKAKLKGMREKLGSFRESGDKKMVSVSKKRISRLKRKTRRTS